MSEFRSIRWQGFQVKYFIWSEVLDINGQWHKYTIIEKTITYFLRS